MPLSPSSMTLIEPQFIDRDDLNALRDIIATVVSITEETKLHPEQSHAQACIDRVSQTLERERLVTLMSEMQNIPSREILALLDSVQEKLLRMHAQIIRSTKAKILRTFMRKSSLNVLDDLTHDIIGILEFIAIRLMLQRRINTSRVPQTTSQDDSGSFTIDEEDFLSSRADSPELLTSDNDSRTHKLPPQPQVFFGRDSILYDCVTAIKTATPDKPVHFAVIGGPGMGKTSLAVAVLHDPDISSLFGLRRFFVSCDAAETKGSIEFVVANQLGIPDQSTVDELTKFLGEAPSILVLDNWETYWEPADNRVDAEAFLGSLAAIPNLHLIVTLRGAERPLGVAWTRPLLPPLEPLAHDSALQAFVTISDVAEDDEKLPLLMEKLDNVPLAVTLMANLAQYETCASLLDRWNHSGTQILTRGGGNPGRNASLDVSIRLSLTSPRLRMNPKAVEVVSVVSLMPDGVFAADLALMVPDLAPQVSRCFTALQQTAIASLDKEGKIRVVAPIREHVLQYHPPESSCLVNLLRFLEDRAADIAAHPEDEKLVERFRANEGNQNSIFHYCLRQRREVRRTLEVMHAIDVDSPRPQPLYYLGLELARQENDPILIARTLTQLGDCLNNTKDNDLGDDFIREAADIYGSQGRFGEQARCLASCVHFKGVKKADEAVIEHLLRTAEMSDEIKLDVLLHMTRYYHASFQQDKLQMALEWAQRLIKSVSCQTAFRRTFEVTSALGRFYRTQGNLRKAEEQFQEGLRVATLLQQSFRQHIAHGSLLEIYRLQARYRDAVDQYRASEAVYGNGDPPPRLRVDVLLRAGWAFTALGEVSEAARQVDHAFQLLATGEKDILCEALGTLIRGASDLSLDDLDAAEAHSQRAYDVFRGARWFHGESMASTQLGLIASQRGNALSALSHHVISLVSAMKCRIRLPVVQALAGLADGLLAVDEVQSSLAVCHAVLPWLSWIGLRREYADCTLRLARIAHALGQLTVASERANIALKIFTAIETPTGAKMTNDFLSVLAGS